MHVFPFSAGYGRGVACLPRPFLFLRVIHATNDGNWFPVWGLVDTGATCTTIPHAIAGALGHNMKKGSPVLLNGFGDRQITGYQHTVRLAIGGIRPGGAADVATDLFRTAAPVSIAFTDTRMDYALLGIEDFLRHFDLRFRFGPAASDTILGNPRGPFA